MKSKSLAKNHPAASRGGEPPGKRQTSLGATRCDEVPGIVGGCLLCDLDGVHIFQFVIDEAETGHAGDSQGVGVGRCDEERCPDRHHPPCSAHGIIATFPKLDLFGHDCEFGAGDIDEKYASNVARVALSMCMASSTGNHPWRSR